MSELVVSEEAIEKWAQDHFADEPFTKLIGVTALGSYLFYKAEYGHNDKVKSIWDAMVYVSTCLSVGYGDIFAKTPMGKLLGTTIMTIGPALANAAFNGSSASAARDAAAQAKVQEEILSTMKQILAELQKQNQTP